MALLLPVRDSLIFKPIEGPTNSNPSYYGLSLNFLSNNVA